MARKWDRAYPEFASAKWTEKNGADLTTATVELGLSTSRTAYPASWLTPDLIVRPVVSEIIASLLIDNASGFSPGTWYLWSKLTDAPEIPPRLAGRVTIL